MKKLLFTTVALLSISMLTYAQHKNGDGEKNHMEVDLDLA